MAKFLFLSAYHALLVSRQFVVLELERLEDGNFVAVVRWTDGKVERITVIRECAK